MLRSSVFHELLEHLGPFAVERMGRFVWGLLLQLGSIRLLQQTAQEELKNVMPVSSLGWIYIDLNPK